MKSIDKINMILMQKGMSGAEMSTKAGFSNSVYSQWNTGKTKPGKKSLVKAAAALEVNVENIMDDDDLSLPYGYQALNKARYDLAKLHHEKAQKEENLPPVGDGLDAEFLQLMARLTDQERDLVGAFAQGLLQI